MKFINLTYFLIALSFYSLAQVNNDSLNTVWKNETLPDSTRFNSLSSFYDLYMLSKPDTLLEVTDFHYNLAHKKDDFEQKYFALSKKAQVYYLLGDIENCMLVLDKTAEICKEEDNTEKLPQIYSNIASVYIVQREYKKGIIQYYKALEISKANGDREGEIFLISNLGIVYNRIGNYDLALEYLEKARAYYTETKNIEQESDLWLKIAHLNLAQKSYTEALKNAKNASSSFELYNNIYYKAEADYVIARAHYELGNLEDAKKFNEISLAAAEKLSNPTSYIYGLILQADINLENNPNLATLQAEKLIKLVKPEYSNEIKKSAYKLLYKCYKAQGKLAKSIEMQDLYVVYNDSLQLEKKNFEVVREAVRNEFENKLNENKLENQKKQEKLKSNQFKTNLAIISIAIILLGLLFFYGRNILKKINQKRKVLIQELETLKSESSTEVILDSSTFELNRDILDKSIGRKLNETDWKVLNILVESPEITNKAIAEKAFMSVDGIGSSLRRMYDYFEIEQTKYKKIALIKEAIKRSEKGTNS